MVRVKVEPDRTVNAPLSAASFPGPLPYAPGPPPLPASAKRTQWELILIALGLSGIGGSAWLVSGVAHVFVLLGLALFGLQTGKNTGGDQRVMVEIDTSKDIRQDIFESNAWMVDDQPMLRQPGGGPLRSAMDAKAGDAGAENDSGQALAGLNAAAVNAGDVLSPGGEGEGSGLGVADGLGGGGGSGVGSADFFGTSSKGSRFVYVIDRSFSMTANGALDLAREELLRSLQMLSPVMEFQVVFYNQEAELLDLKGTGMVPATKANRDRATNEIYKVTPDGGTEHVKALTKALNLRPDVIFFLSDADDMELRQIKEVTRLNTQRSRRGTPATIHVIQFHHELNRRPDQKIKMLATQNKGTYRLIDTNKPPGVE